MRMIEIKVVEKLGHHIAFGGTEVRIRKFTFDQIPMSEREGFGKLVVQAQEEFRRRRSLIELREEKIRPMATKKAVFEEMVLPVLDSWGVKNPPKISRNEGDGETVAEPAPVAEPESVEEPAPVAEPEPVEEPAPAPVEEPAPEPAPVSPKKAKKAAGGSKKSQREEPAPQRAPLTAEEKAGLDTFDSSSLPDSMEHPRVDFMVGFDDLGDGEEVVFGDVLSDLGLDDDSDDDSLPDFTGDPFADLGDDETNDPFSGDGDVVEDLEF